MANEKKLSWFKYMWSIFLVQSFVVCAALVGVIAYQRDQFETPTAFWLMISFTSLTMAFISYFGLYKRWKIYLSEK